MDGSRVHGMVLRGVDYQENMRIVTLFSREEGLINFLVKGRQRHLALTAPLSEVEIVLKKGRNEGCIFVDGSVISENLHLRSRYTWLETAGELAQSILFSQMKGKAAPLLYELFQVYLRQIAVFPDLSLLKMSFKMKLLVHEGVLALSNRCAYCGREPTLFLDQGQSLCAEHRTRRAHAFSDIEWRILLALESVKRFAALQALEVPSEVIAKISEVIKEILRDVR